MPLFRSVIDIPRALLRRSYDWTIRWADTSQALIALFLIALAESSFFPIPPDVLLIASSPHTRLAGFWLLWFAQPVPFLEQLSATRLALD